MREKVPNRHLAALMREADVSSKGLAKRMYDLSRQDQGEEISPTHTNVEKWLSGDTRRPKARTCHVLVRTLGQLVGRPLTTADVGYGEQAPEGADSTLEYPATVSDSVVAMTQLANAELRPSPRPQKLIVVPEVWNETVTRWMFDGEGAETRAGVEPRLISEYDVEAVRDATSMFAGYDYRYGGGRGKPLVAKFLESDVLPLLRHVSPESSVGREYFREVASMTRLAGWTSYDVGEHALAQRYLLHAFRLARAAGDKPLCGRILAGMSHQANFLGHYDKAVHLARAATHGAAAHATPTSMALFHAMEARALSSQGAEGAATSAMSAAEDWLGRSVPDEDPVWIKYFDLAELHAEFAHCFRDLGKADLATHHASASIDASESLYVRSLSFCRTVLAASYVQSNELEQAVSVARDVVDTAARLKSYRVIAYLRDFRGRLDRHADDSAVREFNEYLANAFPSEGAPVSGKLTLP